MTGDEDASVSAQAQRLHDLRQPLAAILAAATALRAHPNLVDSERDAFLEVIVRNAERLGEMLDQDSPD